jgi:hypothetical protein
MKVKQLLIGVGETYQICVWELRYLHLCLHYCQKSGKICTSCENRVRSLGPCSLLSRTISPTRQPMSASLSHHAIRALPLPLPSSETATAAAPPPLGILGRPKFYFYTLCLNVLTGTSIL